MFSELKFDLNLQFYLVIELRLSTLCSRPPHCDCRLDKNCTKWNGSAHGDMGQAHKDTNHITFLTRTVSTAQWPHKKFRCLK